MPLPFPSMNFTPLDPLTAQELNDMVSNIEALQDFSAFDNDSFPIDLIADGEIKSGKIDAGAVTPSKISSQPTCRVFRNTAIAVPNATETNIVFNNEELDSDNMYSTSVNPDRITVVTPGIYVVYGTACFNAANGGTRYLGVCKNNVDISYSEIAGTTAAAAKMNATMIVPANAGDYFTLKLYQSSGSSQSTLSSTSNRPSLAAHWMGPLPPSP